MEFADYLRFEGRCSIALGLALALAGLVDGVEPAGWLWLLLVPLALLGAGRLAQRRGLMARDLWRLPTRASFAGVRDAGPVASPARLRVRLAAESAAWVVASVAWLATAGDDGGLFVATGLLSAGYGLSQSTLAARMAAHAAPLLVSRRPALGTPQLVRRAAP